MKIHSFFILITSIIWMSTFSAQSQEVSEGEVFKGAGSEVYILVFNQKRHIASNTVLIGCGLTSDSFPMLDEEIVRDIPAGEQLTSGSDCKNALAQAKAGPANDCERLMFHERGLTRYFAEYQKTDAHRWYHLKQPLKRLIDEARIGVETAKKTCTVKPADTKAQKVITDVVFSSRPESPGPEYTPLVDYSNMWNIKNANFTTGIEGTDVWIFVKYENYIPGGSNNPENALVQVDIRDWGSDWKPPKSFGPQWHLFPPRSIGGNIPSGAMTPGSINGCNRMGMALRYWKIKDLEDLTKQQPIINKLFVSVTKNNTPRLPIITGWTGLVDAHKGCGDDLSYNIFLEQSNLNDPKPSYSSIDANTKQELMKKYQPMVYLASDEEWRPSTVDFFIPQMKKIKIGPDQWFTTRQKLSSPSATLPFFKGQDPNEAEVYAFWVNKFYGAEISYFYFYPYNFGKEFDGTVYGNHVGDWEHATVRLTYAKSEGKWNLSPYQIYISAHEDGYTKSWVNVDKHDDTHHPIIFSAKGSHAMYFTKGRYTYNSMLSLTDTTSEGLKYYNQNNLVMFDKDSETYLSDGKDWPSWLNIFRWGNQEKGCIYLKVLGISVTRLACELENGPTGPKFKDMSFTYGKYEQ